MSIEVPNKFPLVKNLPYRLAIIGDAPQADDETLREAFVNRSASMYKALMPSANILSSACFFGNVAQTRAPSDQAERLSLDGWQVAAGVKVLKRDIEVFDPNLVLLLGQLPCKVAGYTLPINDARGSLFVCHDNESPFYRRKCLVTLSPFVLQRQYDLMPLMQFDLRRAREEAETPELVLLDRRFDLDLSGDELVTRLDAWPTGQPCSLDIEGSILTGITCISFAPSKLEAFIVDYVRMPEDEKPKVALAVARLLARADVPKILQNSMYDNFTLAWKHKMPIVNVWWDTMLSSWEIFPELPKKLGVLASLWTKEPYYKAERKSSDWHTHLAYCCKDSTVTYEIAERQQEYLATLPPAAKEHFDFNMRLLPAFLYMQTKGIKFDREFTTDKLAETQVEMHELQARIDTYAGGPLNINSPKQVMNVLYSRLGYEAQYKKVQGRKTSTKTADAEALLILLKKYNAPLVYNMLVWRQRESFREQLMAKTDDDGRIRTAYNPVGTDTGRLACYTSNTGSGYNLQTVMKASKPAFIPDDGMWLSQCDLSGADGWTVALHCARLHDTAMLDDYLCGVKPAKVVAAMHITGDKSLARMSSIDLRAIVNSVDIPVWLYNACKAIQHGTCYGMGVNTMSTNILKRSWKDSGVPVHVAPRDCRVLQNLFLLRYVGVSRWQDWVKAQIVRNGCLESASGHVRHFFGRRTDNSTYQAALAHEPQINTTYATNLALSNLWSDTTNRAPNGELIIQPLHQIHDAVLAQFPKHNDTLHARKLAGYFNNVLTIAGQSIVIPFEGEYGSYWGANDGGTITS